MSYVEHCFGEWPLFEAKEISVYGYGSVDEYNLWQMTLAYPAEDLVDNYKHSAYRHIYIYKRRFFLGNTDLDAPGHGHPISLYVDDIAEHPETVSYFTLYRYCRSCCKICTVAIKLLMGPHSILDSVFEMEFRTWVALSYSSFNNPDRRCEHCQKPLGVLPWLQEYVPPDLDVITYNYQEARTMTKESGYENVETFMKADDSDYWISLARLENEAPWWYEENVANQNIFC